jgi:hypothetical protein
MNLSYTTPPPTLKTSEWSTCKPKVEPEPEPKPETCPICMEQVSQSDCDELACGHKFCSECIDTWLCENSRCPLCRKNPVMEQFKCLPLVRSDQWVVFNNYAFNHSLPRAVQLQSADATLNEGAERVEQRCAEICIQLEKLKNVLNEHFQSEDGEAMTRMFQNIQPLGAMRVSGGMSGGEQLQAIVDKMHQESRVAHSIAVENKGVYPDWRAVPGEDQTAYLENAWPIEKNLSAIVTNEIDDEGKEYAILHPAFDVPASVCPGGDPRERHLNGRRCDNPTCPCQTFVSRILTFEGETIKVNGQTLYRDQTLFDREVLGDADSALVLVHGRLFRSDVVAWDRTGARRRLFPRGEVSVPSVRRPTHGESLPTNIDDLFNEEEPNNTTRWSAEVDRLMRQATERAAEASGSPDPDPAPVPDPLTCPWNVGDSVIKISGIHGDMDMVGYIIYVSPNGRKIKVKWGEGNRDAWNLQSWRNFEIHERNNGEIDLADLE